MALVLLGIDESLAVQPLWRATELGRDPCTARPCAEMHVHHKKYRNLYG